MIDRFETMKRSMNDIIAKIKDQFYNGKVINYKELKKLLSKNKNNWHLAKATTVKDFIKFLTDQNIIKPIKVQISKNKSQIKYLFGEPDKYLTPLTIAKDAYFSHFTAMYLHDLTEYLPKKIYITTEQSQKNNSQKNRSLKQKNIDKAFSKSMRKTNHIAEFDNFKVYILNGKFTDKLGVPSKHYFLDLQNTNQVKNNVKELFVTDVERTLLDCTIRPGYCGGVQEVLEGYKRAQDIISVNKLLVYLKKMDLVYPYHQAIGFYLEKANYGESQLKLVENIDIEYDFYLTYNIKDKTYSKRWQLYYPKFL